MNYKLSIPCLDMDCKEYSRHVDIIVDKLGYDNICKYIQDNYYQFERDHSGIPEHLKDDPWYVSLVTNSENKEYQEKLQDIHLTLKRLSEYEKSQLNKLGTIKIGLKECDFEYTQEYYDTHIDITRDIISIEDLKEILIEKDWETYAYGESYLSKTAKIEDEGDALSFIDKNGKTMFSIYKEHFEKIKDQLESNHNPR